MLNLHNILWVVPGVLFIHFFNKLRSQQSISLSGWPYVFFIVVIAALTWLPAEWILKEKLIPCISINKESITAKLIISSLISFVLLLLSRWKPIAKLIFLPVHDHFYKNCIIWENEIVLLTLKNGKAYIGVLWKYPENPRSRHESQTISIIPIRSGYRKQDTKQVEWNINYPEYKTVDDWLNMETIIPRSEIITFGKFSKKTFKYFGSCEKNT